MMLKSYQNSACDGEQLNIKCNEDYIIDIITAEHTILVSEQHSREPVQASTDSNLESESSANPNAHRDRSASSICAPLQRRSVPFTGGNGNIINDDVANDNSSSSSRTHQQQAAANVSHETAAAAIMRPQTKFAGTSLPSNGTGSGAQSSAAAAAAAACNQEQAQAIVAAQSSQLVALVRNECHLKSNCTLDFMPSEQQASLSLANNNNNSNNNLPDDAQPQPQPHQRATTAAAAKQAASSSGYKLSKLINEVCPLNRKIVEVVYKCRPMKFVKRVVCRGNPLQLNCTSGSDKRILIAGAEYGSWASDKGRYEQCLAPATAGAGSDRSMTGAQLAAHHQSATHSSAATTTRSTCLAPSSAVTRVVFTQCLMQDRCKLDVLPSVLGDTKCPPDVPEYIKVMFTCVSESLIHENSTRLASSSGSMMRTPLAGAASRGQQQVDTPSGSAPDTQVGQTFISANVSSSSLLRHQTALVAGPGASAGVGAAVPDRSPARTGNRAAGAAADQADQVIQFQYPPAATQQQQQHTHNGSSERLLHLMMDNPDLAGVHPSQWSFGQRAKFLALRYQPLLVLATVATTVVLVGAFVVRICLGGAGARANGKRTCPKNRPNNNNSKSDNSQYAHQLFAPPSTSSSSASSSSSAATSGSSSTAIKSPQLRFGSGSGAKPQSAVDANQGASGRYTSEFMINSSGAAAAAATGQSGLPLGGVPSMFGQRQQQQHPSGSESCFSLDADYLAADSPALQSTHTPLDSTGGGSGCAAAGLTSAAAPPACFASGTARPKLWTIYGSGGGAGAASTMRAPTSRTFSSSAVFGSSVAVTNSQNNINNNINNATSCQVGASSQVTVGVGAGTQQPPPPPQLRTPMGAVESWCATLLHQQHQQQQQQQSLQVNNDHQLQHLYLATGGGQSSILCPAHQHQHQQALEQQQVLQQQPFLYSQPQLQQQHFQAQTPAGAGQSAAAAAALHQQSNQAAHQGAQSNQQPYV